ncbi:ATP-binding cassette domain-containing protein [Nocardioides soli]|uniref:NitT/TauT family transport system ATP-binding protein n=1 Tax=Nocardioides soli TaxID=1036020 RepID=A0A7W4VV20_9ACTN|nr:NitT/TauT family transport system ATP-binding protein [Nocardioides soli]
MTAAPALAGSAVRLADISVEFVRDGKPFTALRGVDLDVADGEFVALLGPSGCGKSTLLRVVSDLLAPATGTAEVLGGPPRQARVARDVGFVFQDSALLPWKKVIDNVRLPATVGPRRSRQMTGLTPEEALALVGLTDAAGAYPSQLSGGMRQRASIARALVTDPRLLLMDEPFGALDEITRDRLNVELLDIWQRSRATVLFVTHSIPEAVFLAQRIVVMAANPGRVHEIVDVPMPYPRDVGLRETPEFNRIVSHLRRALDSQR